MSWIALFGGLCLLIYGLGVTRDHLQKIAGDQLSTVLSKVTQSKAMAFITGFFLTLVLQSSSATIAMVVGFASSALLTLAQCMAMILGADVGTTITVQLLAFHFAEYSLLFVVCGFLAIQLLGSKRQSIGYFILGIGFIFMGMWQMGLASSQFKDSTELTLILGILKQHPFVSFFFGILMTAILQSSAAAIGILLSLAHYGTIPLSEALPLMIGANVGGCTLPAIVSIKMGDRGRQVAAAHLLVKVSGAILIFPFLSQFETLISWTSIDLSRQIANAHFIFNASLAILFIPFTKPGAKMIDTFFPSKPEPEAFKAKYLDSQVLSTPSFAFGQAKREIIRMAEIVQEMLEKAILVFKKNDLLLLNQIEKLEDRSDILYKEIKKYLVQISGQTLTSEQADQQSQLVILTCDLENIGDAIVKSLLPLARIKITKKLHFSDEGFKEILEFHKQVVHNFQLTISAFTNESMDLYKKVIIHRDELLKLELQLRERHLVRLRQGVKEALDTSAIHIELLSHFGRINAIISNIAYQISHRSENNGAAKTETNLKVSF